jgi:dephospho-CoA kinase
MAASAAAPPPARARTFSVGLTGGIGCGKTTVADQFGALGATLVDTDQIAHGLTAAGGAAMPALVAAFGADIADASGALARARMRELVFADPAAKRRLEAIVHPLIRAQAQAAGDAATGPYVVYVVPLLVESGNWRARVDRVLAIDCHEEVQVARVMTRNGLAEAQVRAIMATQATRADRLAAADDVLVNDGPVALLAPQIAVLHQKYLAFAERMPRM